MSDGAKIDVVKGYHHATKHSYWSVRSNYYELDLENRPFSYKQYYNLDKVELFLPYRSYFKDTLSSLWHLHRSAEKGKVVNLAVLAEILQTAYGLTGKRVDDMGMPFYLRSAPSAGALYPVDVYVVAEGVNDLRDGLYHYSVFDFNLSLLREGPFLSYVSACTHERKSLWRQSVVVILTSILWRTAWKYRDRAYRYVLEDVGHVAGNFFVAAASLGLETQVVLDFSDQDMSRFLNLDNRQEVSLALLSLGSLPDRQKAKSIHVGDIGTFDCETNLISEKTVPLLEIFRVHEATCQERSGFLSGEYTKTIPHLSQASFEGRSDDDVIVLPKPYDPRKKKVPLHEAIFNRRTCRKYANEQLALKDISTMLYSSTQVYLSDILLNNDIVSGSDESNNGFLDIFVVAENIDQVTPGLYVYDKDRHGLVLCKEGDFRRKVTCLCLEQEFIESAGAVFFLSCCAKTIFSSFGPRGYRTAFICSGLIAEYLYLSGEVLDVGVGSVGSFYDDDILEFLELPKGDGMVLLAVIAGKKRKKKKKSLFS